MGNAPYKQDGQFSSTVRSRQYNEPIGCGKCFETDVPWERGRSRMIHTVELQEDITKDTGREKHFHHLSGFQGIEYRHRCVNHIH